HAVVIGGGTMGSGIAIVFAAAGWQVSVVEPDRKGRDTLLSRMGESMHRMGITPRTEDVTAVSDLGQLAWDGVAIVIENATEDFEIKRRCFAELERLAPAAIPLATNSTGYFIKDIAQGLGGQERMLGVHFLMPAQFVPLVEIVPSERTSPRVVED